MLWLHWDIRTSFDIGVAKWPPPLNLFFEVEAPPQSFMLFLLQKSLVPPLPSDLALSFYLQGWKLVFAVYHLTTDKSGAAKFSRYQAEAVVPWINEVLLLLTVGMQTAQQLRDKVRMGKMRTGELI